jgi:hypothetical protein
MSKRLTVAQRREIFHTLVATQDEVPSVRRSYELVAKQFAITENQLRQIEDEGIERQWPPLEEVSEHVGA